MKIFEYIKKENETTIKICGRILMTQTFDYVSAERCQNFLGGLITTLKANDLYGEDSQKDIKIFGRSVIKRNSKNNFRIYYLNGKEIKRQSFFDEFKKQIPLKCFEEHDDIYILRANSGEIYLILVYLIDSLIKRNQSKKPLLLATKKYHVDMIRALCPDIPHIYIEKMKIRIADDIFTINNLRFFLLFTSTHFKQVERDIKNNPIGKYHYFQAILQRFNIAKTDISMRKVNINPQDEHSMLHKIAKMGLNIDNFIFLSPEAHSSKLCSDDFWCKLIRKLQERGYDIFINLVGNDVKLKEISGCKTENLSFSEAFALAKKAKRIIMLRSGFVEFLLQTGVEIDILYTGFRHRHSFNDMDVCHVMSGFSIAQIPFVDKEKIREFNMSETSEDECINAILEKVGTCNGYAENR